MSDQHDTAQDSRTRIVVLAITVSAVIVIVNVTAGLLGSGHGDWRGLPVVLGVISIISGFIYLASRTRKEH